MATTLTPSQISQYETLVSLPPQFHHSSGPEKTLAYLSALHIHHITTIPYENLNLHYSSHHSISIDPQVLFQKIVGDGRGRGGYCMETSLLFNHVLKALGWEVYTAGVRIRPRVGGVPSGDYIGWVHLVNIVTLPTGEKYMLDVGFGGDGPTHPLPLIPQRPSQNLGNSEVQLLHTTLPHSTTSQLHWVYQSRNSPSLPWNSFYAFPELEFFPADFEIMNYYTSTYQGGSNLQTRTVLGVKFIRGVEEGEIKVIGKVMLVNGEVKRNLGGRTEVVRVCNSEEERVLALREFFGIELTEEERESARGRNVEIV